MIKTANKLIESQHLYLRELTLDDATAEYCSWLNNPQVNKYLETRKATVEYLRQYIQQQIDDPNSRFFGVFTQENNLHIGNVKLEPIDWPNKRAIFGILIGNKNYWGQGVGTEATRLTVDYAFTVLGLETIELGVIAENERATRAYEKVGFKTVTVNRKAIDHNGVLYDDIIMVIKKGEPH